MKNKVVKYLKYLNCNNNDMYNNTVLTNNFINSLLHRYSFLRLLQQTTFENIVTKEEIAPAFENILTKEEITPAGAISSFAAFQLKIYSFFSAE